jgi:hypothetical protein
VLSFLVPSLSSFLLSLFTSLKHEGFLIQVTQTNQILVMGFHLKVLINLRVLWR